MSFTYSKGISPQGHRLYALLNAKGVLAVRDIAALLHIQPNAVYRITHYLEWLGLIESIGGRPLKFSALAPQEAQENYLLHQRILLREMFAGLSSSGMSTPTGTYAISFLQGREAIFQKVASDLHQATKEARFIVLGLPIGVSPELMLEQRNAVARGVPVRIIAQEYSQENRETLRSWKTQGLDVRHGKPIGFHLLLIDDLISYLMYYDPRDKTKRYAVRMVHQAINRELQAIFEAHWRKAKPIRLP